MHWMCCARIRASQHSCARSAAGCVLRGENAALRAGAGVEHRYLPRASTRRSDARQEARGTSPSYPACPMVQGAESGCWTALPRVAKPSRGCRMVRRASHREHAKTARPAVSTARAGCLACTHRRPGRRPRPPRGGRDCRIARDGMGLVFLCFWLAPKKSISTRRWIPTRCERVWYSKQGTKKLNASITCWASGCGKTQPEGEVPRESGSPSRQSPVLAAPHSHAGIPTQYRKAQCLVRLRICAAWTKTVSDFVPGGGV